MKIIEVDEELYQYIASQTQSIGESASDILRRLLNLSSSNLTSSPLSAPELEQKESAPKATEPVVQAKKAVENRAQMEILLEPQVEPVEQQKTVAEIQAENSAQTAVQKSQDFVEQLLQSEDFKQETKGVVKFLSILTALYQTNAEAFAAAIGSEEVQGRTRQYFAQDEKTLLAVGNHTKPKAIPNSPYWVITNNNSGRKLIMLEGVMREMGLANELIEEVKIAFAGN